MIDIQCSCGSRFEVADDQDPAQVACPGCGATAAELIALAESQAAGQAEPVTASPAPVDTFVAAGGRACVHRLRPSSRSAGNAPLSAVWQSALFRLRS